MFDVAGFGRDLRDLPRIVTGAASDRAGSSIGLPAILALAVVILYCILLVGLLGAWSILAVPIYLIATLVLLLVVAGSQAARSLRLPLAVGGATASLSVLVAIAKLFALT